MLKQFWLEVSKRKLIDTIINMKILTLEEYTIGSCIGSELTELYKNIVEAVIGEIVEVSGEEISDGKYEIVFHMPNDREYVTISKGWYTKENIQDTVMDILLDYYQDLWENKKRQLLNNRMVDAFQ